MMTLEDIFVVLLVKEEISLDRVYPYILHKYWLRYCPNSSQSAGVLDTCSTENPRNQCKQRIITCQSPAGIQTVSGSSLVKAESADAFPERFRAANILISQL